MVFLYGVLTRVHSNECTLFFKWKNWKTQISKYLFVMILKIIEGFRIQTLGRIHHLMHLQNFEVIKHKKIR
jgi:hypothetical protein